MTKNGSKPQARFSDRYIAMLVIRGYWLAILTYVAVLMFSPRAVITFWVQGELALDIVSVLVVGTGVMAVVRYLDRTAVTVWIFSVLAFIVARFFGFMGSYFFGISQPGYTRPNLLISGWAYGVFFLFVVGSYLQWLLAIRFYCDSERSDFFRNCHHTDQKGIDS